MTFQKKTLGSLHNLPIVCKNSTDKERAVNIIDKLYGAIKIPFHVLYLILILILASIVLVIIAIANGSLDVSWFCYLPGICIINLM